MSLINNWLELRSDAFKIAVHVRRPIPTRTDTIGPWLDTLTFLTWLAALTNSALVYLFRPGDQCKPVGSSLVSRAHDRRLTGAGNGASSSTSSSSIASYFNLSALSASPEQQLLVSALLVALAASHGYILLRTLVRHALERLLWRGSAEEREAERVETVVKEEYLRSLGVAEVVGDGKDAAAPAAGTTIAGAVEGAAGTAEGAPSAFWSHDEGLDELSRGTKDA